VVVVQEAGEGVGYGGGGSSNSDGLDGATEPAGTDEFALERSEEGKGDEGDDNGELEGFEVVCNQHIREQWDETTGDVGGSNGEGGAVGSVGGRLFKAKLEAHHEVDPSSVILLEGSQDRSGAGPVDGVLLEDGVDLLFFVAGAFDDLALFSLALGDVVLGVAAGSEVAAEAHGDGAGGDLGQAGQYNDMGGRYGSGEASGEGEGNGEAVGEPDDDVANNGGGLEVAFYVGSLGRVEDFVHGGSLVPDDGFEEDRQKFL
jgi:hypothetical protein